MPAAARSVRIDLAVRPWRPITLPRSSGATRSSNTVICSPSMALTATSSGRSTRALAMASTNSFTRSLHEHAVFNRSEKNRASVNWRLNSASKIYDALNNFLVAQKAPHGVAGLGTAAEPVFHALGVELDRGWFLQRIVRTHDFNEAAIARTSL